MDNVILCIDAKRAIDDREPLPHGVHVTRYDRRVAVEDVLAIIESSGASSRAAERSQFQPIESTGDL